MTDDPLIHSVLDGLELRAAAFIVTVYGDIALPRGGVLWTGTLIELCDRAGINESLVRTAVSRLVAARRLSGERVGRRSYYRLNALAQREFDQAARLLYAPDPAPHGWQILHAPDLSEDEALSLRLGHMGGPVYLRPDRGQAVPRGALMFRAEAPAQLSELGRFWNLSALDVRYRDILGRFAPVEQAALAGRVGDESALVLRLLLVHAYRAALLRDPRLPAGALPADWRGTQARALFRRLYPLLTPGAERHIAAHVEGIEGPLPGRTPESDQRLRGMT